MTRERRGLYPATAPYVTGMLKVSDLHEIYFEECGNPEGKPALMVHGGPGGGSNPTMRRYHDPDRHRIILFDQRGCGRSTPHAELRENTTWHLVQDMERLREHLGIERWQLLGGSWGSTLSLAYAQTHPERVSELILRGVFTLRRAEIEWFYQEGASWLFPGEFEKYQQVIPPEERGDMVAAYYRRLTGEDKDAQLAAARAWSVWEGSTLSLLPDSGRISAFSNPRFAIAFARIESHYFVNGGFLERDGQLIEDATRLNETPGVIVHGRYDVCTPVRNAYDLAKVWTNAELRIVPDSGHAMTEAGIVHELISATDRFRDR